MYVRVCMYGDECVCVYVRVLVFMSAYMRQYTKSRDEAYTRLTIRPPGIRTKDCTLMQNILTDVRDTFFSFVGTNNQRPTNRMQWRDH